MTQDPLGPPVWVLADPRAGTAAQALGIAERLGVEFRVIGLQWGTLARLPIAWPSLAGLTAAVRAEVRPPWPRLTLSAGRRSAPVARWLGRQGARTVHCMRPGFGAAEFDLLVIGAHDRPQPAPNLLEILGACHRMSPARLAAARAEWAALAGMPSPRVALLVGGPVRAEGMRSETAADIGRQVAGMAGSVLATTSRRTGAAASEALSAALAERPHRLFRWGEGGANPYAGFLAWADAVVVTGDSVSMLSEALATAAPVFIADPGGLGPRHGRLRDSLVAAGQARMLGEGMFGRSPLDESARVAAAIRARGWGVTEPGAGAK
ncbi:mitochondrial fission ELM1 family protein [Belnapia sp. T6]|uniref:Mitochondrial fission ELM1 family protein n=1 Tax=Belnapia mucosa TaxID=2804532 RepID=A0ABS1V6N6_9PROT|nr:ELM1/GtrOC1 family putative glycosyltransferase [Belnapia mucosa]MBL6456801.1 mitochondrial fission ELM1 family protein [Belnapia mucosa]